MPQPLIRPAYARFDPAHAFDGLFVPTKGKKRGRLLVEPRRFGKLEVGFQGFEQLGADDQSILLALTAQLGIDGLVIYANPTGPVSKQLRFALDFRPDDGAPLLSKRTSLRSLLIDAGYKDPERGFGTSERESQPATSGTDSGDRPRNGLGSSLQFNFRQLQPQERRNFCRGQSPSDRRGFSRTARQGLPVRAQ